MAIHRGGSYNSGAVGASPTMRGHTGMDNRSSMGEGFRIAEDETADAGTAAGISAFEKGLAAAQAAERAKRK